MSLIDLLTDFDGRCGRRDFWLGNGLVAVLLVLTERAATLWGGVHDASIIAFIGAFALFPWAALAAKRANDRGRPSFYGSGLVVAIVLLGLGASLAAPETARWLGTLSLLLWLVALVDLGLMPGRDARSTVAEPAADAKPAA